ncbi:unnamed protein product [marine sediment metagenome]|uniref:HD domain-containing protein n=1 Tax=marine sediment metagenome TaxID=412755 RepID=X1C1Y1_9ZZZZ
MDNIEEFIKIYLTDYSKQIFSHLNKLIQGDYKKFTFLKLAAFLHDIGKSETKVVDNNGRIKFYNHQNVGAEKIEVDELSRALGNISNKRQALSIIKEEVKLNEKKKI